MKVVKTKNYEIIEHEKYIVLDYCCDRLKKWLELNGHGYKRTLFFDTKENKLKIRVHVASTTCYNHEEEDIDVFEDLKYCLFCGAKLVK